jgi:hypothetical protein
VRIVRDQGGGQGRSVRWDIQHIEGTPSVTAPVSTALNMTVHLTATKLHPSDWLGGGCCTPAFYFEVVFGSPLVLKSHNPLLALPDVSIDLLLLQHKAWRALAYRRRRGRAGGSGEGRGEGSGGGGGNSLCLYPRGTHRRVLPSPWHSSSSLHCFPTLLR